MRSIRVFLFVITLLSLGACYSASTAQIISPEGTIQAETTSLATIAVNLIPVTEEVFTPTLTTSPIRATNTLVKENEFPISVTQSLTITIVYDNNPFDPRLEPSWGFSALIEYHDYILLFDTGGDGRILMENMHLLGIDPTRIDSVVLSHAHDDHTGGLTALLDTGAKPVVYLLPSFPLSFKRQIEQYTQVNEVSPGQSLAEGLWTTGEIQGEVREQALVIRTDQGLVIITGCAHPGIVSIVEKVREMLNVPIHLVVGGFHLVEKSEAEVDGILDDFRRLGVEQVAPSHCTGEYSIARFAEEYGEDFIQVGVGSVLRLEVITPE